jgi:membrane-associated protease RseP (regulator of RpoE activity)
MSEPSQLQPEVSPEAETAEFAVPQVIFIPAPRRRYWLHALLFGLTILTTTIVGARLQSNFNTHQPLFANTEDFFPLGWILSDPRRLVLGIPFSFTLLLILTAHEMGHYLACVRYRVYATLPFFIPAPTLIGTMGAFIRIRSPIPSRKSLFDIGVAGPIAGFMFAVPALAIGLLASQYAPEVAAQSELQVGFPLIFRLLHWAMPWSHQGLQHVRLEDLNLHPIAIAAWVGMFATSLNLLPGGQLDGGHIVYALFPRIHSAITRWLALVMIVAGLFLWPGWILWAVFVRLFGRHPQVPGSQVSPKRRLVALFGFLMFVLTVMPNPFPGTGIEWDKLLHWMKTL